MANAMPEMERIYDRLSLAINAQRMTDLQKLLKEVAELAETASAPPVDE